MRNQERSMRKERNKNLLKERSDIFHFQCKRKPKHRPLGFEMKFCANRLATSVIDFFKTQNFMFEFFNFRQIRSFVLRDFSHSKKDMKSTFSAFKNSKKKTKARSYELFLRSKLLKNLEKVLIIRIDRMVIHYSNFPFIKNTDYILKYLFRHLLGVIIFVDFFKILHVNQVFYRINSLAKSIYGINLWTDTIILRECRYEYKLFKRMTKCLSASQNKQWFSTNSANIQKFQSKIHAELPLVFFGNFLRRIWIFFRKSTSKSDDIENSEFYYKLLQRIVFFGVESDRGYPLQILFGDLKDLGICRFGSNSTNEKYLKDLESLVDLFIKEQYEIYSKNTDIGGPNKDIFDEHQEKRDSKITEIHGSNLEIFGDDQEVGDSESTEIRRSNKETLYNNHLYNLKGLNIAIFHLSYVNDYCKGALYSLENPMDQFMIYKVEYPMNFLILEKTKFHSKSSDGRCEAIVSWLLDTRIHIAIDDYNDRKDFKRVGIFRHYLWSSCNDFHNVRERLELTRPGIYSLACDHCNEAGSKEIIVYFLNFAIKENQDPIEIQENTRSIVDYFHFKYRKSHGNELITCFHSEYYEDEQDENFKSEKITRSASEFYKNDQEYDSESVENARMSSESSSDDQQEILNTKNRRKTNKRSIRRTNKRKKSPSIQKTTKRREITPNTTETKDSEYLEIEPLKNSKQEKFISKNLLNDSNNTNFLSPSTHSDDTSLNTTSNKSNLSSFQKPNDSDLDTIIDSKYVPTDQNECPYSIESFENKLADIKTTDIQTNRYLDELNDTKNSDKIKKLQQKGTEVLCADNDFEMHETVFDENSKNWNLSKNQETGRVHNLENPAKDRVDYPQEQKKVNIQNSDNSKADSAARSLNQEKGEGSVVENLYCNNKNTSLTNQHCKKPNISVEEDLEFLGAVINPGKGDELPDNGKLAQNKRILDSISEKQKIPKSLEELNCMFKKKGRKPKKYYELLELVNKKSNFSKITNADMNIETIKNHNRISGVDHSIQNKKNAPNSQKSTYNESDTEDSNEFCESNKGFIIYNKNKKTSKRVFNDEKKSSQSDTNTYSDSGSSLNEDNPSSETLSIDTNDSDSTKINKKKSRKGRIKRAPNKKQVNHLGHKRKKRAGRGRKPIEFRVSPKLTTAKDVKIIKEDFQSIFAAPDKKLKQKKQLFTLCCDLAHFYLLKAILHERRRSTRCRYEIPRIHMNIHEERKQRRLLTKRNNTSSKFSMFEEFPFSEGDYTNMRYTYKYHLICKNYMQKIKHIKFNGTFFSSNIFSQNASLYNFFQFNTKDNNSYDHRTQNDSFKHKFVQNSQIFDHFCVKDFTRTHKYSDLEVGPYFKSTEDNVMIDSELTDPHLEIKINPDSKDFKSHVILGSKMSDSQFKSKIDSARDNFESTQKIHSEHLDPSITSFFEIEWYRNYLTNEAESFTDELAMQYPQVGLFMDFRNNTVSKIKKRHLLILNEISSKNEEFNELIQMKILDSSSEQQKESEAFLSSNNDSTNNLASINNQKNIHNIDLKEYKTQDSQMRTNLKHNTGGKPENSTQKIITNKKSIKVSENLEICTSDSQSKNKSISYVISVKSLISNQFYSSTQLSKNLQKNPLFFRIKNPLQTNLHKILQMKFKNLVTNQIHESFQELPYTSSCNYVDTNKNISCASIKELIKRKPGRPRTIKCKSNPSRSKLNNANLSQIRNQARPVLFSEYSDDEKNRSDSKFFLNFDKLESFNDQGIILDRCTSPSSVSKERPKDIDMHTKILSNEKFNHEQRHVYESKTLNTCIKNGSTIHSEAEECVESESEAEQKTETLDQFIRAEVSNLNDIEKQSYYFDKIMVRINSQTNVKNYYMKGRRGRVKQETIFSIFKFLDTEKPVKRVPRVQNVMESGIRKKRKYTRRNFFVKKESKEPTKVKTERALNIEDILANLRSVEPASIQLIEADMDPDKATDYSDTNKMETQQSSETSEYDSMLDYFESTDTEAPFDTTSLARKNLENRRKTCNDIKIPQDGTFFGNLTSNHLLVDDKKLSNEDKLDFLSQNFKPKPCDKSPKLEQNLDLTIQNTTHPPSNALLTANNVFSRILSDPHLNMIETHDQRLCSSFPNLKESLDQKLRNLEGIVFSEPIKPESDHVTPDKYQSRRGDFFNQDFNSLATGSFTVRNNNPLDSIDDLSNLTMYFDSGNIHENINEPQHSSKINGNGGNFIETNQNHDEDGNRDDLEKAGFEPICNKYTHVLSPEETESNKLSTQQSSYNKVQFKTRTCPSTLKLKNFMISKPIVNVTTNSNDSHTNTHKSNISDLNKNASISASSFLNSEIGDKSSHIEVDNIFSGTGIENYSDSNRELYKDDCFSGRDRSKSNYEVKEQLSFVHPSKQNKNQIYHDQNKSTNCFSHSPSDLNMRNSISCPKTSVNIQKINISRCRPLYYKSSIRKNVDRNFFKTSDQRFTHNDEISHSTKQIQKTTRFIHQSPSYNLNYETNKTVQSYEDIRMCTRTSIKNPKNFVEKMAEMSCILGLNLHHDIKQMFDEDRSSFYLNLMRFSMGFLEIKKSQQLCQFNSPSLAFAHKNKPQNSSLNKKMHEKSHKLNHVSEKIVFSEFRNCCSEQNHLIQNSNDMHRFVNLIGNSCSYDDSFITPVFFQQTNFTKDAKKTGCGRISLQIRSSSFFEAIDFNTTREKGLFLEVLQSKMSVCQENIYPSSIQNTFFKKKIHKEFFEKESYLKLSNIDTISIKIEMMLLNVFLMAITHRYFDDMDANLRLGGRSSFEEHNLYEGHISRGVNYKKGLKSNQPDQKKDFGLWNYNVLKSIYKYSSCMLKNICQKYNNEIRLGKSDCMHNAENYNIQNIDFQIFQPDDYQIFSRLIPLRSLKLENRLFGDPILKKEHSNLNRKLRGATFTPSFLKKAQHFCDNFQAFQSFNTTKEKSESLNWLELSINELCSNPSIHFFSFKLSKCGIRNSFNGIDLPNPTDHKAMGCLKRFMPNSNYLFNSQKIQSYPESSLPHPSNRTNNSESTTYVESSITDCTDSKQILYQLDDRKNASGSECGFLNQPKNTGSGTNEDKMCFFEFTQRFLSYIRSEIKCHLKFRGKFQLFTDFEKSPISNFKKKDIRSIEITRQHDLQNYKDLLKSAFQYLKEIEQLPTLHILNHANKFVTQKEWFYALQEFENFEIYQKFKEIMRDEHKRKHWVARNSSNKHAEAINGFQATKNSTIGRDSEVSDIEEFETIPNRRFQTGNNIIQSLNTNQELQSEYIRPISLHLDQPSERIIKNHFQEKISVYYPTDNIPDSCPDICDSSLEDKSSSNFLGSANDMPPSRSKNNKKNKRRRPLLNIRHSAKPNTKIYNRSQSGRFLKKSENTKNQILRSKNFKEKHNVIPNIDQSMERNSEEKYFELQNFVMPFGKYREKHCKELPDYKTRKISYSPIRQPISSNFYAKALETRDITKSISDFDFQENGYNSNQFNKFHNNLTCSARKKSLLRSNSASVLSDNHKYIHKRALMDNFRSDLCTLPKTDLCSLNKLPFIRFEKDESQISTRKETNGTAGSTFKLHNFPISRYKKQTHTYLPKTSSLHREIHACNYNSPIITGLKENFSNNIVETKSGYSFHDFRVTFHPQFDWNYGKNETILSSHKNISDISNFLRTVEANKMHIIRPSLKISKPHDSQIHLLSTIDEKTTSQNFSESNGGCKTKDLDSSNFEAID